MGKATIVSHYVGGFYAVTINKDETGYARNIATAAARKTELDTVEIPALIVAEQAKETAYGLELIAQDAAIVVYTDVPVEPSEAKVAARLVLSKQQAKTINARLEWEEAKLAWKRAVAEGSAVSAYKLSQEQLKVVAADGKPRDVWCADLTISLTPGTVVGIFDIPNETFNNKKASPTDPAGENTALAIIRPAAFTASNEVYSAPRDGIEQTVSGAPPSGAQTFWNWAVKPAWAIAKPTARIAEVIQVYYDSDTADVRVLDIPSWVQGFGTVPWGDDAFIDENTEGEFGIFRGVPVEYMTCNARAFAAGDRVVVEFEGQSEEAEQAKGKHTGANGEPVQLSDSTAKFITAGVQIGSSVANLTDGSAGLVVSVDSETAVTVDDLIGGTDNAFDTGDLYIVSVELGDGPTGPRVVGFEKNPRECTTDGFNYTRYNIAGPYAILNDVGGGWTVDTTGSPILVEGNIDVQTHGQTRTNGGLVPDPIRFNGPYRRHIAQLMDETLDIPQPVLWEPYWFSGRTIDGLAPGKLLGIGSQDDIPGDSTFAMAAVIESSVSGSEAPPNTIGFYRRQYDGSSGLYEALLNPNGWRKVGSYTFSEVFYEGHDLPVFFSADGTKAVHVRYKKPVVATGTFQARTTKGDNSASPTLKNLAKPRMFDTEMVEWTFAKDYATAPTAVVTPGGMADMKVTRTEETPGNSTSPVTIMNQNGSYIVGAEYLDDVITVCRYKVDHFEANAVETTSYTASPSRIIGKKFYDLDIKNELKFERWGITGTAVARVEYIGFDVLRDTSANFKVLGAEVGMEIENLTTVKKGTILEVISDSQIRTTAMLQIVELEQKPLPIDQGWSVGDAFRINTASKKTIPITLCDWHTVQVFDSGGPTTLDGIPFSQFQASAEFDSSVWSTETNGTTRWFQAALAYLDPRYGTAILDIHRLDGGDPYDGGNWQIIPGASDPVSYGAQTFYTPSYFKGVESIYYAVYTAFGEVGRLEWGENYLAFAGAGKVATDFQGTYDKQLLEATYVAPHIPIGVYYYFNYEPVPAFFMTSLDYWPYEAGEAADSASRRREFMQQPVGFYQGQYQLLSNSLRYERDRAYPTMPSYMGYYEWTDNVDALDKKFSYWYSGTPSQWQPTIDEDWLMNNGTWGLYGAFTRNGMRSFTCDLSGFTFEPLPVVPMIGYCATTDGFDVFFSGYLLPDVIDEGFTEERTVPDRYAFLSGEGSNLAHLTTVLGGTDEQWFPLGVAPRN